MSRLSSALFIAFLSFASIGSISGQPPASLPSHRFTLLDEVGRLTRPVSDSEIASWKRDLKTTHPPLEYAARLHVWLGEAELAKNQQPDAAIWHFRQAQRLSFPNESIHGLAAYDSVVSTFYAGRYAQAAAGFDRLLKNRGLSGYNRRTVALWKRHADGCAGYHADHHKLGIPQPKQLDPLCGVSGLAICLQALGLPHDKARIASVCRYT